MFKSIRPRVLLLAGLSLMSFSLAACSSATLATAWHWNAFTRSPDQAAFDALHTDVAACKTSGCPQGKWIRAAEIDALTGRVSENNDNAIRIAVAGRLMVDGHGLATLRLRNAVAATAASAPEKFLGAMQAENCRDFTLATILPVALDGNYRAQIDQLEARRAALSAITDPSLVGTRGAFVVALQDEIDRVNRGILPPVVIS